MVHWRGGNDASSTGEGTLTLPPEAQLGDLLVCADWNNTFADPRLTKIEGGANDGVWVGYATTLDPLIVSGSGEDGVTVCGVFASAPILRWEMSTGATSPATAPSVEASGTILVTTFTADGIGGNGGFALPPGYSPGSVATFTIAGIRVDYWNGTSPSPTGAYAHDAVSESGWRAVTIVPGSAQAPPCRLTGRGDSLGAGAGRIYPPGITQQAGRLHGPC